MIKSLLPIALFLSCCLLPQAEAAIEFIYAIKEKVYDQQGNAQPVTPTEWSFGSGASGDDQLTAVSVTLPGEVNLTVIVGEDGSFELDPDSFSTQAALDAAYPNGNVSFSVTDGGNSQGLGPFSLTGDAYPIAPQITNALELQASDYSQDFLLTWNAFTGADSDDRIIFQLYNDNDNEELFFEFLDATDTSFTIPGGTLSDDKYYEVDVIFVNETIGLVSPETIIGYLSTTSYLLSTHTSGGVPGIDFAYTIKEKSFQQNDNTAPTDPSGWSFGAGVQGGNDVTGGSLDHPGGNLVFTGSFGEYDTNDLEYASQAELDAAFPNDSYTLNITVDGSSQVLGPFVISGDAYPAAPHFLNIEEFKAHDHTQNFTLNWTAYSGAEADDRILLIVNGRNNDQDLPFEFLDPTATSYEIPGGTLTPENQYEFDILFIKDTGGLETPDTIIGYISGTTFDISTITSDTELAFYKTRINLQTASDQLQEEGYRSLAVAIGKANAVVYAEINLPGASNPLNQFASNSFILSLPLGTKETLDAAYPPGEYRFFINENGEFITYDGYILPPDAYPGNPILQNFDVLQSFDASQEQSIQWDTPSGGVTLITLQIRDQSNKLIWSADLGADVTSAMLPPDTLNQLTDYTLAVRFWARQAGSEFPDASLGYQTITQMSFQTYPDQLDFATWLQLFFSAPEILDLKIAGPDADPDGDKLSNRFEFLAKLSPIDGSSAIDYDFSTDPSENLTVSPLFEGVNWDLQSSPDLQNWTTVPAETYEVDGSEIRVDLESFLPNPFFQVVLTEATP